MINKAVVIAGTHERETEFSYPVIDLLLKNWNITAKPREFEGEDLARKALVWDVNDSIALAKVVKTGPLSRQYVDQMPIKDRLSQIVDLSMSWSPQNHYEPAHTHKGIPQWTSVHDAIVKETGADLYFDLHSNHNLTRGLPGTLMQINSYAEERFHRIIVESLSKAQTKEPLIYGTGQKEFNLFKPKKDERELVEKRTLEALENVMPANEQVEILTTDPTKLDPNKMVNLRKLVQGIRSRVYSDMERESILSLGNQWFFTKFGRKQEGVPNYFLFEAITWGQEQQRATANFISNYLVGALRE